MCNADVIDGFGVRGLGGLTSVFAGKIVEKKKSEFATEFSDWEKRLFALRANTQLAAKARR